MVVDHDPGGGRAANDVGHGAQLLPRAGIDHDDGVGGGNRRFGHVRIQFQDHTWRCHEFQIGRGSRSVEDGDGLAERQEDGAESKF